MRLSGKAFLERPLEGIHVVDALADERALAEQVLIHVGDGARVGVDAGLAAEQARVAGLRAAGQHRADSRLQNAVALADAFHRFAIARAIQRMGHRAHQSAAPHRAAAACRCRA